MPSASRTRPETFASRVVPEARGEALAAVQQAEGYREQVVADATGQAGRFSQVYEEYRKAPDVIRERIFLETMERVSAAIDKIIIDQNAQARASCPIFRSTNCTRRRRRPAAGQRGQPGSHADEQSRLFARASCPARLVAIVLYSSVFIVQQTQQALVLRFGARAGGHQAEPGLYFKLPLVDTVNYFDKRVLDLDLPVQTCCRPTGRTWRSTPSRAIASSIRCASIRPSATSRSPTSA